MKIDELPPKQKKVLNDLQNGYELITGNNIPFVVVAKDNHNYKLGANSFWNMVRVGIIVQELSYPFNYVLTQKYRHLAPKGLQTISPKSQSLRQLENAVALSVDGLDTADLSKLERGLSFYISILPEIKK